MKIHVVQSVGNTFPLLANNGDEISNLIESLKHRFPFDSKNDPVVKLMEVKDPKVTILLINALKNPNAAIRQGAALTLGYRLEQSAVLPLIECLSDKDPYVQATAVSSLGKLKDNRAITNLMKCLEDSSTMVRHCAAITLGKFPTDEVARILESALQKEVNYQVRKAIQVSLSRMGYLKTLQNNLF